MTMHVNLSPEMEGFIKSKVASGFYSNATEVIRDAIRRMQADDLRAHAFRAAVQVGEDQLRRGEGIAFDEASMDDIESEARENLRRDAPIDPNVVP